MITILLHLLPFLISQTPSPTPLQLWATWYYTPTLDHDSTGIPLLDLQEQPLGPKLDSCDWCHAAIEGTVYIRLGEEIQVLNYAGRSQKLLNDCRECPDYAHYDGFEKTGRVLWQRSEGFGLGVNNFKLVPFKSVAVDPAVIPYGSVLHIPDAEGVKYLDAAGDTLIHDGYFFAADAGSKIKGNHIDVYLGDQEENPFGFVKSRETGTFQAFWVKDEVKERELRAMHR
ncbi:MAG: hypothetical protein H6581_30630 [Bacteroidia bacterium]|nr:hypothetical protein [Bacteroidia bacterium]